MTSKDIEYHLETNYFKNGCRYIVPNIYAFNTPYTETDLLVVKDSGYVIDIEIKISKSDFLADKKKIGKHQILKSGHYTRQYKTPVIRNGKRKWYAANTPIPHEAYPNRFYYAVPENLISISDLPDYAGLLYVKPCGNVVKVKESKLLHKNKLDVESLLCRKFYFRWKNCKG